MSTPSLTIVDDTTFITAIAYEKIFGNYILD